MIRLKNALCADYVQEYARKVVLAPYQLFSGAVTRLLGLIYRESQNLAPDAVLVRTFAQQAQFLLNKRIKY
jgi:hypothetical protein